MPVATNAAWVKTLGRLPWWRNGASVRPRVAVLSKGPHSFAATQLDLPNDLQARLRAWVQANVAREDLSPDEAQDDAFHVTVLYGLKTDQHETIRLFAEGTGLVRIELGAIAQFDKDPRYDVLIVPVVTEAALRALRQRLTDNLPWEATQSEYVPHVTLAYVRKGAGRRHLGAAAFLGETATLDRLRVSDSRGETSWVSLLPSKAFSKDDLVEGPGGKLGVWRTVRGRKVFIEEGQSLEDALNGSSAKGNGGGDTASKTVTLWKAERRVGDIKGGPRLGEFFSDNEATANNLTGGSGKVVRKEVRLNKPLIIPPKTGLDFEFYDAAELNTLLKSAKVEYRLSNGEEQEVWRHIDDGGLRLVRALKKAGYDSMQFPEFLGGKEQTTTLVFDLANKTFAQPIDPLKEGETLTFNPETGERGVWRNVGGRSVFIAVKKGESVPEAVKRVDAATSGDASTRKEVVDAFVQKTIEQLRRMPSFQPSAQKGGYPRLGRRRTMRKVEEELTKIGVDPDTRWTIMGDILRSLGRLKSKPPEKSLALVMTPHGYPLPLAREPTRIERKVDFATIVLEGDRLQTQAVARVQAVLANAKDKLLALVERKHQAGELTARFVLDLELRGLGQLVPTLREALSAFFRFGQRTADGELRRGRAGVRLFKGSADAQLKMLIAAHPEWSRTKLKAALTGNGKDYQVKLVPEGLPPEAALEFFERKASLWATDVRGPLLQSAKAVLFDAIKRGAPLRETMAMLEQVFLPWLGDEDALRGDGDVTAPFRLETLVRTNTNESFNEGRKAQFQEEVDSGFVIGFQFSAIIDSRTTPVCAFLDEKIFRTDSPELDRLTPPRHFGCRSILSPVLRTEGPVTYITPRQVARGIDLSGAGFAKEAKIKEVAYAEA